MKKIFFLLLTILTFPLSAFDWGGFLDNTTAVKGELSDMGFVQTDRLTLWLRAPFNASTYLTAEGFYEFGYISADKAVSNKIDISLLKFSMAISLQDSSDTVLNMGRYGIRDITGLIISQPSDGIGVVYSNNTFSLNTYIGFTGLLNGLTVDINTTNYTTSDADVSFSGYIPATPFVLASVTAQFPYFFGQQSLSADIYATFDVAYKKTNRVYATAGLNGPISGSLFYIFSTSLGFNQINTKWQMANLSIFEISTFLPVLSSLISWKTTFATGGSDASFETFTVASASMDDSLDYSGNIKTGLIGTIRPIDSLLLFVGVDAFLNVMNDDFKKGYAGMQWVFSTRWQIISDIQLAASAGQFFSANKEVEPYMLADLKLLFSF